MNMQIQLTLVEDMLATRPANRQITTDYIISKAPTETAAQEEETAQHNKEEQDRTCVFDRMPKTGEIFIWNYMLHGFLKAAGTTYKMLYPSEQTEKGGTRKWSNIKSKIDRLISISPRRIQLGITKPTMMERSLRGETPRGPRITLVRSEVVPSGTKMDVCIRILSANGHGPITPEMVAAMLDYGQIRGLGAWRNGDWGRFQWKFKRSSNIKLKSYAHPW